MLLRDHPSDEFTIASSLYFASFASDSGIGRSVRCLVLRTVFVSHAINKRSDPNLVEKGKESLRIQGHICMRNTISYREALSATDPIENPSIGFAKPSDYQGITPGIAAIIKQNNTQIHLLIQIAEPLRDIQQELRKQNNPPFPQDLVSKLQNLSLGPSKPKEKPGKLRQAARRLGRQLTGGASSRYTLEQQLEPEA
ncbi:hypothetical protein ZIOFF_062492 [Zingiber officinale]|uniref:Uncharacterized protein n=1 Tax=Zingiber officinale TaxID=94328 RepID=A0A8J5KJA1_ZINOF|nr:hypothetical protein ZIOFF_062492 [Zingiber officinale]